MADPILKLVNLAKAFGGLVATDNLNFEVQTGELHAIIGPNGAGKTTLINQISGMMQPDSGRIVQAMQRLRDAGNTLVVVEHDPAVMLAADRLIDMGPGPGERGGQIVFDGENITQMSAPNRCHAGLVRSFQITSILKNFTVADHVALGIQARQGHSFKFWAPARGDAALRAPAMDVLNAIGLGEHAEVLAGNLAHGEQRQLEIAMALATSPKMLLLDEPMAGMGPEESERMTAYLSSLKGQYTMLLIEHDMDAVFALADRITVLVYGQAIASGAPDEIRTNEDVRRAYLGDD